MVDRNGRAHLIETLQIITIVVLQFFVISRKLVKIIRGMELCRVKCSGALSDKRIFLISNLFEKRKYQIFGNKKLSVKYFLEKKIARWENVALFTRNHVIIVTIFQPLTPWTLRTDHW